MPSSFGKRSNPVPLEEVLTTAQLQERPSRAPDYEREVRALSTLAQALADSPDEILQRLTEAVMEVCEAGSAGVSLLREEGDTQSFYWPAIAGKWKEHIGSGLPYDASPCGVVVSRNERQLFTLPERHYEYMVAIEHPIQEALLAPFSVEGRTVGTVWVIAHDAARKFDLEDARLLTTLSRFAAAAYQTWKFRQDAQQRQAALRDSEERFRLMADHAPVMVWMTKPDGYCTYLSKSWHEFTGQPPEEGYGFGWLETVHPDDQQATRMAFADASETNGPFCVEYRLRHKEGGYRWAIDSAQPRFDVDGRFLGYIGSVVDIHERKEAETILRLRSEQFETLINQAPIGVYLIDADFRVAQVNPIALPVFADLPDPVGRDFGEVLHAMWHNERAEEIIRLFRRTLETGEPFHAPEFAEHRLDRGVTEYYDWRIERIVLPDGHYGVVCYFVDISEQVRARNAIANWGERYYSLFNSIDEGFCVIEVIFEGERAVDYRFLEINPVFEKQTGMKDALGRTIRELVPNIEPVWTESYGKVALTGEPIRFADHSESMGRWFDVYAFRVGEPYERKVAVLFTDVSDRKKAEQALRKSEERLQLAKSAAQLGLHDFNPATGQVDWDDRTRELWGVEPDEPITYEAWRESVHPDDLESAAAAVTCALDPRGDGQYFAQYRVTNRKDGITRWIEANGRATFAGGKAVRMVGTVQDITERKRTEEALKEADRRKDEFIATLAHELRNPLAAIRMALGVLGRSPEQTQIDQMKSIIDRQSSQLVRLIDDLLDVSRITRGKIELHRSRVDLAVVIEHALEGVRETCDGKGLRFNVTMPKQPIVIHADAFRFAQVLSNLLNNACKFTDSGGEIHVSVEHEDSDAVVRVRDTGEGIPQEELPQIFEMFAQVRDAGRGTGGGLGIGLALAKSIVALHGGTIEAHSEGPGRGSEFIVRVPAVGSDAPPSNQQKPSLSRPLPLDEGARVLAVDDNRDALDAVAMMLRLSGHNVDTAGTGEDAIERARTNRPEVILLDIGLPGIDGYEVARRIRREPWGEDVFLIAMTGWGQKKDKQRATEAGFDAHLTKPADPDALDRLLRDGLAAGAR